MKFLICFFHKTALSIAIEMNNKEIIQILLSNHRVNPNIKLISRHLFV